MPPIDRPSFRLTGALLAAMAVMASPSAGAAMITVTTLDDAVPPAADGLCSLREALANATDDAATFGDCPAGNGDDEITFAEELFPIVPPRVATVQLAGQLIAGKVGDDERHAIAIRPPDFGVHRGRIRLLAPTSPANRVFSVRATAAPFILESVEIRGGRQALGNGAGIHLASDDARFVNVDFIDNQATQGNGGALYQALGSGFLELDGVRFTDNLAARGGAIYLGEVRDHWVRIDDCQFVGNEAWADSGGAIAIEAQANLSPEIDSPRVEISTSLFRDNRANVGGGAVFLEAGDTGDNQAFYAHITNSQFSGNVAGEGGAMDLHGSALNRFSSLTVARNSFIANQADLGGALSVRDTIATFENNLFAENVVSYRGGALLYRITSDAPGWPSIRSVGNTFHAQQLTGSQPDRGGRTLWIDIVNSSYLFLFQAGNLFAPLSDPLPVGQECRHVGSVLEGGGGYNLTPVADCLLEETDILADPQVEARSSGDPLHPVEVLPQTGSPAIDAWPQATCLAIDLRGALRPADGDGSGEAACDIGAFELPDAAVDDFVFSDGFED